MPTNKQRIAALAATATIVLGGGWLASLISPANASGTDAIEVGNITPTSSQTKPREPSSKPVRVSQKEAQVQARSGKTMQVSINGIRNNRGKIYIALFDNADAFNSHDYDRAVGFVELPAKEGSLNVNFPDLAGKPYAMSVFHDENGNQNFDLSGGYPSEGYGTSHAKSAYDEPKFHQASLKPGSIGIRLHYLR
ncbi:DUF2141 domain-containing protein [Sphingorhabdus sp. EL138]|uniref:DUF2141 domain-containing protein n=1 Tax=Sphingorhabdus sp. EL138 TaxID=2073156 RepID=UPI000D69A83C|nr:DUF2141 domain-containing protein [Sphingorhabdus sp. EL138]